MVETNNELFILGKQAIISCKNLSEEIETFYSGVIPELQNVARCGSSPVSLIGYRIENHSSIRQFLGITVSEKDEIPNSFIRWKLSDNILRVDGGIVRSEIPIQWKWKVGDIGEFDILSEGEVLACSISALSIIQPEKLDSFNDSIELVPFSNEWKREYLKYSQFLKTKFPDIIKRIEHYGSTSISGIAAKPIIDILVEVESYDIARKQLIPGLLSPEMEYWWYDDHMIFIQRDKPMGKRTHHLHIAPKGHRLWDGLIFRDALRDNPKWVKKYESIKLNLAGKHKNDRETYTKQKGDFIKKILKHYET